MTMPDEENKLSKKRRIDWESVERDYRAGVSSVREIARLHGISDTAIRKKATMQLWERDLTQKVQEQARAELVRGEVGYGEEHIPSTPSERQIVETAAATVVQVVREHRARIRQGHALVELLTQQLLDVAGRRDEFEQGIEADCADDKTGTRQSRLLKAVSLSTHAALAVSLATATKTWIGLERQAFNLRELAPAEDDVPAMTDAQRRARLAALQEKLYGLEQG
ncbi:hypothetical protein ACO0K9_12320 [Undibacterium sp. Ji50W]|uniref:hypothetical protein n=1 Tax=Undibacterium sp. Ji50W TaxID=3413041 RepID=UPI003BF0145C